MSIDDTSDDLEVAGALVRRLAPVNDPPPASCPKPDLLVGLADDRLLPEERVRAEGHVAACASCRAIVAALVREAASVPASAPAGRIVRPLRPRVWLAAAAVLFCVGIAIWGPGLMRGPVSVEELLVASAGDLARARPELFSAFRPLERGELEDPGPPVLRSGRGLVPLYPARDILETTPSFRWERPPAISRHEIVLETEEGRPVWRERWEAPGGALGEARFEYPSGREELAPGRYFWYLAGDGPSGAVKSDGRAFRVAARSDREAFQAARAVIETSAPARVRKLLVAHLALRRGYVGEAEAAAREHLAGHPDDAVGLETLGLALRLQGSTGDVRGALRDAGTPPR